MITKKQLSEHYYDNKEFSMKILYLDNHLCYAKLCSTLVFDDGIVLNKALHCEAICESIEYTYHVGEL